MSAGLTAAWAIARRELRGAVRALVVVLACLALGVAMIAAVGVLAQSIREALRRDARVLLGGDVVLESANQPVDAGELSVLLPAGAQLATTVRTTTLLTGPTGRRLPVSLKAVDPTWPLLGEVTLDPPLPVREALDGLSAVVEEAVLARLDVRPGEQVQLGRVSVTVRAVLVREPDRLAGFAGFGPRVVMSRATLEAAEVLRPGALVRFEHRAVVPSRELEATVARLSAAAIDRPWRLRTAAEVEPRVARFTDRLAGYLTLAGLAALLVGGLGVALAVGGYLAERQRTIAILKAVGATAAEVDVAYALVLGIVATAGIGAGLLAGQLLPFALAGLLAGLLPVAPEPGVHPAPLGFAAAVGLLVAASFAAWPLARARAVSAASLLRAEVAPPGTRPRAGVLVFLALAAGLLVALVTAGVDRPMLGLVFAAGMLVAMVALAAIGRLLLMLAARWLEAAPLALRLAARNLSRPASGALPALMGLGGGLGVLVTIGLLEANLLRELELRLTERAPSHVVIDIQPDQWEPFARRVAEVPGATILQAAPTLRARVVRIKGQPVEQVEVAPHVRWTIEGDRGLTWQATPPPGTELVAGSWWPADYDGPPLLSIEAEVARGYGVGVGDRIAFNVLGRVIEAEIANVRREVDWGSGRLDFVFVLSPGVIDRAPHVRIAAIDVPSEQVAALLDRLAAELPNVTPIEIGTVVREVAATLERIAGAVRLVAAVTLLAGLMVLAAALQAARRRHLQQTVLFKILGASRRQILGIFLSEQLLLALLAGCAGSLLGIAAAWVVVRRVLELGWTLPLESPLVVVTATTLAVLVVSVIGVRRLLGRSAAAALRAG